MRARIHRSRRVNHVTRGGRGSRGAALITAMLIAALAAVMVAGMLWQQWGTIERERTAREAAQARWLLRGTVDWARLILRENARNAQDIDLGQPWAVPLAESSLSTFLAARDSGAGELADTWLEGHIVDAQSRFNLATLGRGGQVQPDALEMFMRLCSQLGIDGAVASDVARGVAAAQAGVTTQLPGAGAPGAATQTAGALPLRDLQDVARLSPAAAAALPRLAPYVTLLPEPTRINLNTADAVVLRATLNISADDAAHLVRARAVAPLHSINDLSSRLGRPLAIENNTMFDVFSQYFDAVARVRIGDFEYAEGALIRVSPSYTVVLRQQRVPGWLADAS